MRNFDSIDDIGAASIEDLTAVGDIGEISARAIKNFFEEEENRKILERLKASGLRFEAQREEIGDALSGLAICITGTLPTMSREQATELIEKNGGKVVGSVSGKTSMLLMGEAAGSKAAKAKELGIRIITEDELRSMLGQMI
jgi:DNA ligase (NAD+)